MKKIYFLGMLMSSALVASTHTAVKNMPMQFHGEALAATEEAKAMFGQVPMFLTQFPEDAIPGAWSELKNLQLSSTTAIPGKFKELIGAAVAAQIPCHYCSYFHAKAVTAMYDGSKKEIQEAIAIAANARNWSSFFNGADLDYANFKKEVDKMYKPAVSVGETDNQEDKSLASLANSTGVMTYDGTINEIQKMYGFVPEFIKIFPAAALPGAWAEVKMLNMNTNTSIPQKYKALISLGVSAQTPCNYCVYMDTKMAQHEGATQQEITEAVAVAGLVRHWSTVLNGNLANEKQFQKDTDSMFQFAKNHMNKDKELSSTNDTEEQTR